MQVKTGDKSFTLGTKLPDLGPIEEEPKDEAATAAVPSAGTQENKGS